MWVRVRHHGTTKVGDRVSEQRKGGQNEGLRFKIFQAGAYPASASSVFGSSTFALFAGGIVVFTTYFY